METGICPEWLHQNNPCIPPVAVESGQPFDYAFFKKYRANLAATKPTMVDPLAQIGAKVLPEFVFSIARCFQTARSRPNGIETLRHHLENFERYLRSELPVNSQQDSPELDRAALDLCRLTARSWAPRRKGYKTEAATTGQKNGKLDSSQ
jgi:hypothetical protein